MQRQGTTTHGRSCLLVTHDVKNAFNSARWRDFIEKLRNFRVPKYLQMIISSYLSDPVIVYETAQGMKWRKITTGAVQRLGLGTDLWNIMFNQVLKIPMPEEIFTVRYKDDLVLLITLKDVKIDDENLNQAMQGVNYWMEGKCLMLVTAKTEIVHSPVHILRPSSLCILGKIGYKRRIT